MSNDISIQVENLSKQYRLGVVGTGTLSHDLNRWWHLMRGKEDPYMKVTAVNDRSTTASSDYVWALSDVNLEVKRGEVLGIIGKNGAGKSTLLKILSRVTGPTRGQIKMKGRFASLLEVGTGFHPELTGRENIYLNGAILGMTKAEVKKKIDEIVDFSGCAMYIDTPVKRYSSGMRVRLGFAVAAHLDPEILIIDEVLAVGDAEFQRKAVGKMKEVSQGGGRTVLFVSHNMTSVKSLCTHAVLMENGAIKLDGTPDYVVSKYLNASEDGKASHFIQFDKNNPGPSAGNIKINSIGVKVRGTSYDTPITMKDPIEINIDLTKERASNKRYDVTLQFKNETGEVIFVSGSGRWLQNEGQDFYNAGNFTYQCQVPGNFFNQGVFSLNLIIVEGRKNRLLFADTILFFSVVPVPKIAGGWMGKSKGSLHPKLDWTYLNTNK